MKKTIAFIMALIFAISLCGCASDIDSGADVTSEPTPPVESAQPSDSAVMPTDDMALPEKPAERLGFSGGNIGAFGLICGGEDGYIYYRSEADWRIWRALPDGSEKMKICDRVADHINVLDGWIYFVSHSDGNAIFRVRTDGTDEARLVEGYCGNLYAAESGIYFDIRDENNVAQIYHVQLDGSELTKLIPDSYIAYYYGGRIYTRGATQFDFGVYDVVTDEYSLLAQTYVHNVSVDDSGIYYWAVDKSEFHVIDADGNDTVVLKGGDYFNYTDGNLYYVGYGENANGLCHVVNRLNIATGEIVTLYEELNEFFDAHGELLGVTFEQMNIGDYDPDIFEDTPYGKALKGGGNFFNEAVGYVYVVGEHLFMRAGLRESMLQTGELDCTVRLDGGLVIWDY